MVGEFDTMLSVIIPVYNECGTIRKVLQRVLNAPYAKELIVVDDGSTDGTRDIIREEAALNDSLKVVFHGKNLGKGAAVRTALAYISGDIVIIQDADLEYEPANYPRLLQPILDGRADVVYGSRFVGGEAHRVLYFWHYVGNRFLTLVSNMFTNLNLTDMETGAKVFRTDIIRRITLEQNRFGFEPEVTAKIARTGCRVYEVGITYSGRTYAEGKKVRWQDGVQAVWCILNYAIKS